MSQAMDSSDNPHKRPLDEDSSSMPLQGEVKDSSEQAAATDVAQKRSKVDDQDQPEAPVATVVPIQEDAQTLNAQLKAAVQADNRELCELLLQKGADPAIGALSALRYQKPVAAYDFFVGKTAEYRVLSTAIKLRDKAAVQWILANRNVFIWVATVKKKDAVKMWNYLITLRAKPTYETFYHLIKVAVARNNELLLASIIAELEALTKKFERPEPLYAVFFMAFEDNNAAVCDLLVQRKLIDPPYCIQYVNQDNQSLNERLCAWLMQKKVDRNDCLAMALGEASRDWAFKKWKGHAISNERCFNFFIEQGAHCAAALEYAVENGNRPLCEQLLNHGADPLGGLIRSVKCKNAALVELFSERGAHTPEALQYAVALNNRSLCERLLKNGADAAVGLRAVLDSTYKGEERIDQLIDLFKEQGAAAPSQKELDEDLRIAVAKNQQSLCVTLVNLGASPKIGLKEAAEKYSKDGPVTSEQLLYFATLFCARGVTAQVAMTYGVRYENKCLFQFCLEKGAVPPVEALPLVARWNMREACELLIKKGARPDDGLREAAHMFNHSLCEFFLEQGASFRALKKLDCNRLLVQACNNNQSRKKNNDSERFALCLLAQGLGIDLRYRSVEKDSSELTALTAAARTGKVKAVEALLQRGAPMESGTIEIATALGKYDAVRKLLLYAPLLIYDKAVVDFSRTSVKTFLLCLRRLGLGLPKDLALCMVPDDYMRPLIAYRLQHGLSISSYVPASVKKALWESIPPALATEMGEALKAVGKWTHKNEELLREILGDPSKLHEHLKDDIQALCTKKALVAA